MDLFPNIADLRICFEPNVTGTFEIAGPQSAHIGSTNGQHRPKSPKKTVFWTQIGYKVRKVVSDGEKSICDQNIAFVYVFHCIIVYKRSVWAKTATNTVILVLVKIDFRHQTILKVS